jgi:hypothetical protein
MASKRCAGSDMQLLWHCCGVLTDGADHSMLAYCGTDAAMLQTCCMQAAPPAAVGGATPGTSAGTDDGQVGKRRCTAEACRQAALVVWELSIHIWAPLCLGVTMCCKGIQLQADPHCTDYTASHM